MTNGNMRLSNNAFQVEFLVVLLQNKIIKLVLAVMYLVPFVSLWLNILQDFKMDAQATGMKDTGNFEC